MGLSLRSNRGRPKGRSRRATAKKSSSYKKGYDAAMRVKTKAVSQKGIKKAMMSALRSRHEDLVRGDSAAAKAFRQGVRDAAAIKSDRKSGRDLAAYDAPKRKPSSRKRASSASSSRKRKSISRSSSSAKGQAAKAMKLYHSGKADTLKEAWAMVKGKKPSAKRKSSPKKRKAAPRKSRASKAKTKRITMPNGSYRYMVDGKFAKKSAYDRARRGGSSAAPARKKRKSSAKRRRNPAFGAEFLFI